MSVVHELYCGCQAKIVVEQCRPLRVTDVFRVCRTVKEGMSIGQMHKHVLIEFLRGADKAKGECFDS